VAKNDGGLPAIEIRGAFLANCALSMLLTRWLGRQNMQKTISLRILLKKRATKVKLGGSLAPILEFQI
jgi:hypothetical protein